MARSGDYHGGGLDRLAAANRNNSYASEAGFKAFARDHALGAITTLNHSRLASYKTANLDVKM